MENIIHDLLSNEDALVPLLVFTGVIALVTIKSVSRVLTNNARERTKREIAAYIAEGSMSPEQGERLMQAGEKPAGKKT